MAEQRGLDLGRIDVHAAGDDEVRAAVGEEEVAVVVDVADVAEGEVRLPVRAGGLLGRLEILERIVGRLQVHGADRARGHVAAVVVEDAHVVRRVHLADRAGFARATRPSRPACRSLRSRRSTPTRLARATRSGAASRRPGTAPRRGGRTRATRCRSAPSRRRAARAGGGTSSGPCACASRRAAR